MTMSMAQSLKLSPIVIFALLVIPKIMLAILIILFYFYIFTPDKPISTPTHIKNLVVSQIPREYVLLSVSSVERISNFEGEHRPMKWLILTLSNRIITDEREMYKIAEPVCKTLLKSNTDYEGIDINPHTTLRRGVNCSAWGA